MFEFINIIVKREVVVRRNLNIASCLRDKVLKLYEIENKGK